LGMPQMVYGVGVASAQAVRSRSGCGIRRITLDKGDQMTPPGQYP
jgi:hypothetical protein